jgi:hypothetical protein
LVVELSALGIAVVTLLLARLDRHKDEIRRRPGVADALIELHRVINGWAVAARDVNAVYQDWIDRGAYGDFDDFDSTSAQRAWLKVFDDLVGGFNSSPDESPPVALGVLETYAPELTDNLRRVSEERLEQYEAVRNLMQDYAENVRSPDAQKLESTAFELERAADRLRQFITENFPARTL